MALPIAKNIRSTTTLSDGVVMPLFGLGVWKCQPGDESQKVVEYALKIGYRMVDTAVFYQNEEDVGRAIRNSGIKREEIFVVDKLWQDEHGYEEAKEAIRRSVKKLGLNYIDLYLIHSPKGHKLVDTFRAMVEMKGEGLVRSVGISNCGIQHLEGLVAAGLPYPSINQVEIHVWQQKPDIVKYCRDHGVTMMGFAPIAKGRNMNDPTVIEMSKRYDKSYAQLLIRWSVQSGFITIPKSSKTERIAENADVFNWQISPDDMDILNALPEYSCTWNPTIDPWEG